ncbi:MAG TPA: hypothetical protein VGO52_11395 [Hyphomonadaceae bacterium]|jgi:hypothetical protein|nr:hypothetical protein [Hyphomonadaceae bacterium]
MNRRRKRRLPFAAYAALIFNAALCASPFIAARVISSAYGEKREAFEAKSEDLSATRAAMDIRFQRLAQNGGAEPREVWANYVREGLEDGDMTRVNGFMLAAPAMLGPEDGAALRERIKVSDQTGDAALIQAAKGYLPEDLQDDYDRRSASILSLFNASAPAATVEAAQTASKNGKAPAAAATADAKTAAKKGAASAKADPKTVAVAAKQAPVETTAQLASQPEEVRNVDQEAPARFSILGNMRDLAQAASRWTKEGKTDEFVFVFAGIGLVLADEEAREGASIVLSARRAQRLDQDFGDYLQRKLFAAAPPEKIKRLVEGELQTNQYALSARGEEILENVFKSSVDRVALESLLQDLRILRDIARDTSPASAVAILSKVKDGADLQRAKLVAQAGGDRAVPLALYDGEHLLDTASIAVTWNNALKLQMAGLIACLALLGFLAMTTFWKSMTRDRPKKRSAVYAMMEEPAR